MHLACAGRRQPGDQEPGPEPLPAAVLFRGERDPNGVHRDGDADVRPVRVRLQARLQRDRLEDTDLQRNVAVKGRMVFQNNGV